MELKIGKVKVTLSWGDIAESDSQAIAVCANDRLWLGGRIGESIKKKAGEEVETEAMKQGPLQLGEVAVSSAGELRAQKILHVVIMGQDLAPTFDSIAAGTKNCLKRAEELKLESVALPAFGTALGKCDPQLSADAMIPVLIDSLLDARNLRELRLILLNEGIYRTFEEKMKKVFYRA